MTEQEYIQDIKKMIFDSLKVEYAESVPNKSELEQQAKNTLATLSQDLVLLDYVAHGIKTWSYNEAAKWQYVQKPETARGFLSLVSIRNYTNEYVKNYEQEKQKKAQGNVR